MSVETQEGGTSGGMPKPPANLRMPRVRWRRDGAMFVCWWAAPKGAHSEIRSKQLYRGPWLDTESPEDRHHWRHIHHAAQDLNKQLAEGGMKSSATVVPLKSPTNDLVDGVFSLLARRLHEINDEAPRWAEFKAIVDDVRIDVFARRLFSEDRALKELMDLASYHFPERRADEVHEEITNRFTATKGARLAPAPTIDAVLPAILSKRQFLDGFIPPDYLVDGILQRGYVYSLTAATGHGKTALALLVARLVGQGGGHLGSHQVDAGNVIYFAGENPADLQARIIGDDAVSKRENALEDKVTFVPGVFNISDMRAKIEAEAKDHGIGLDLVVTDTSAAYFLGRDELSNTEMGDHARLLRTLTTLPGRPTVLVLCHPIKHAAEPSQLLPRGGGAFLAEVDGNLTLWKKDEGLIELSHGKMRGAGFEPTTFKLEKIITAALVDSKGRAIPTVRAVPVSDHEQEAEARYARTDEDHLLVAMLTPGRSVAQLGNACGWKLQNGDPHKSKVSRVMKRLETDKLVKQVRGAWELTETGRRAATAAEART